MTKGYGFTVDDIDWSCPADLEPYEKAYRLQLQKQDSQLHTMGMYNLSAFLASIERSFKGKDAKYEYVKEPFLSDSYQNNGLSEEEIQEKEIRKAILEEEAWINACMQKGLPETKIKKK